MDHYAGIDVSLERSSVCVVDATGRIIREAKVASGPEALVRFFRELGLPLARVGLEAGPLSQWLIWGIARQAGSYPPRGHRCVLGRRRGSRSGGSSSWSAPRRSPLLATRPPGRVNSYPVGSSIRTMIPRAAGARAPRGRIHLHGGTSGPDHCTITSASDSPASARGPRRWAKGRLSLW